MVDFSPGDVVIGGAHGYAEHINSSGVHQQHIELRDDEDNLMKVWGACFDKDGAAWFALGQIDTYEDYTPHDICYIPGTNDPKQFAVLVPRLDDTLELWIYQEDGLGDLEIVDVLTGLDTDTGWDHETPCKLAVACDGDTVLYTDQGKTIFTYSITGGQQAPFAELDPSSPYIYGGIDIDRDGTVYRAMTTTGIGPRRDVSLGSSEHLWADQINESPVRVYKRLKADGEEVLNHEVSLSPDDDNTEVLSLAAYYYPCFTPIRRRVNVNVSG